jgi:hypothetical protein
MRRRRKEERLEEERAEAEQSLKELARAEHELREEIHKLLLSKARKCLCEVSCAPPFQR